MTQQQDVWHSHFLQFSPMFNPLATVCFSAWRTNTDWPLLTEYNRLLVALNKAILTCADHPIQFVAHSKQSDEFSQLYEPRIYLQGEIATRERNWHDFFNMLVWLTFPKAKAALNGRQYLAIKKRWPQKRRTIIENALTHFDESGVIVVSSDLELDQALIDFRWKNLFLDKRQQVQSQMAFFLFGHSLYEKALKPFVGMTGKAIILHVENDFFSIEAKEQIEIIDAMLADQLSDSRYLTSPRQLTPLPVLGVPGWWGANENAAFYDNTNYFRTKRNWQLQSDK